MEEQAKKHTAGKSTDAGRTRRKGSKAIIKDLDAKRTSDGVKGGGNSGSQDTYWPAKLPK